MNFTQHITNNRVLGAPPGFNTDERYCNALPVTATEIDGMPAHVSFWRPTAEELQQLAAGALVTLCVYGALHPPVWVGVEGK